MLSKKNTLLITLAATATTLLLLTQIGSTNPGQGDNKLEGAWVGKVVGMPLPYQWTYTLSPDPSGRRASMTFFVNVGIQPQSLPITPTLFPDWEYNTPGVGELVMTGPDTAVFTALWYGMKKGFPADEIVLIGVNSGTVKFTGPGKSEVIHNLALFDPSTDVDKDGLPDPGTTPTICLPAVTKDTRLGLMPPCKQ
jgi:hypothetical protein